eukprot:15449829-Alexandrium_andersonii.AAC.1
MRARRSFERRAYSRPALAYAAALQAPRGLTVLFQHSLGNIHPSRGLDSSRPRRRRSSLLGSV